MNMAVMDADKANAGVLLVVDDDRRNRAILRALLEPHGHTVVEACNGEEALKLLGERSFDAVLLDVMMPGMDGFEACRRIKSGGATQFMPVLLVTALSDRSDRLKGIESGANDFLTKPVDTQEVLLRVRNSVHAKHLHDSLQSSYDKLRELETLRDNLTHMIVHDMRSPLTALDGFIELVKATSGAKLDDSARHYLDVAIAQTAELVGMVNSLLDVNKLESGKMELKRERCDLCGYARDVVEALSSLKETRQMCVDAPPGGVRAECDGGLMKRVIGNLVGNALKFTPRNGAISVVLRPVESEVEVRVDDTGPGIPPEYRERIFEKFVNVPKEFKGYSTGLGLTFCKLVVDAHGGRIWVESEVGKGSSFRFRIPAGPKSA
jgi:two-component system sensor histidine kinase/response regulator